MNIFVFDIETIPDIGSGRKLYNLHDLSDCEVLNTMQTQREEKTGSNFMPLHLHQIVAISVVYRHQDKLSVWSLGEPDSPEPELIHRFFKGIEKYTPTIVSWNGSGFDLPVLHYRTLLHGIEAPRYWEVGEHDQSFKWNNYINRYHHRHLDLMDVLAGYQGRANAPLDDISTMLGFPGKMGQSGSTVWQQYFDGDIQGIRNYCETDVLNTYLVYLRFERMRGQLTSARYDQECQKVRNLLTESEQPHLQSFLNHWT